jgi:hypothetical protein
MSDTSNRITTIEIQKLYSELPKEELIDMAIEKTKEIWELREKLKAVQGEYNRLVHK